MSSRLAGLLTAVVFLAIGVGQVALSLRLPNGLGISAAEPGPGLFPSLVGALMVAAAAAHLVQVLLAKREEEIPGRARRAPIDIVLLTGAIAAYILLLPRAGFALSAFLLLLATLSIYGMPGRLRRVATAAAATAVAYAVFKFGLRVSLPASAWFG